MEAYGTGVTLCAVGDGDRDRKHVRAVGASDGDAEQREALVARRIQQLEQGMAEQKREIRQLRASGNRFDDSTTTVHQHYVASGGQPCPPVYYQRGDWPPTMTPSSIPSGQQHTYFVSEEPGTSSASWHGATTTQGPAAAVHRPTTTGRRHGPRLDRDTCARCGQKGHWQRSCPLRVPTSDNVQATQANIGGVSSSSNYSETYLEFDVNGIKGQALIDTGCDHT